MVESEYEELRSINRNKLLNSYLREIYNSNPEISKVVKPYFNKLNSSDKMKMIGELSKQQQDEIISSILAYKWKKERDEIGKQYKSLEGDYQKLMKEGGSNKKIIESKDRQIKTLQEGVEIAKKGLVDYSTTLDELKKIRGEKETGSKHLEAIYKERNSYLDQLNDKEQKLNKLQKDYEEIRGVKSNVWRGFYHGITGHKYEEVAKDKLKGKKASTDRENRYKASQDYRNARLDEKNKKLQLAAMKQQLKIGGYGSKLKKYEINQLKDILKDERKLGKISQKLFNKGSLDADEFLDVSRELYKDRRKTLEDLEGIASVVLILGGAFFISMSREGMYFTGNLVKEQSFVAMNGLGIGIILSIAALVVLFVKVLLRKH